MAAYPLGAHVIDGGVNFAVAAPHAERVELCLFEGERERRLAMQSDAGVWHCFVPDMEPGQVYGYRVHGPFAPDRGHRFNPELVLLDPYAREIVGDYHGQDGAFRARVCEDRYDWGADTPPRTAPEDTVLYEVHVKGFTRKMAAVPEALRGTYAGLASEAALDHLQQLGVTAVSLLPVHQRADEPRLLKLGLSNYWGYSTIGFFAPEQRYWSRQAGSTAADELRDAIKALHAAGIEVILDVVYNHTAELDELGPTLCFRALDNALYYHLASDAALYENWTGCGNTLDLSQPRVLQLVMDSLRYWVQAFHVDGFRFDLATILGRSREGFSSRAAFFAAVAQDPVLARVKLIAEPWDIGPHGYQLGRFPAGWMEWNDQFRDTMRGFWLRGDVSLGRFALRFAGSSDIFETPGRTPSASVNFICAHDGFTLRDLVSYNDKHNEANGEHNRDGHAHNLSWNCGVEGLSDDPAVNELRLRLQRAMLATLVFAHGTPMLLAGDEIGHSQHGNNNAYCQDNDLTWLDWPNADRTLLDFTARLVALRRHYPSLRRDRWHEPIAWLGQDGHPLAHQHWSDLNHRAIAIHMGECLLMVNAGPHDLAFALPPGAWTIQLNSAEPGAPPMTYEARAMISARTVLLAVTQSTKL